MAVAERPLEYASRPRTLPRIRIEHVALAAAVLAFCGEAIYFVFNAYLNRDEGWYLLSGQLTYSGQLPYRDFPYFQTPLGPYLFGAAQSVFGTSIVGGRFIAASMGLCSIALVVYIGERLRGMAVALIALALLLVTPDFMLASVTARSEAIVIPLTLLALALALRFPDGFVGFVAAPAVLLLCAMVRLTFVPAFAIALVYCWWRARPNRREAAIAIALLVAFTLATTLPFVLASPHHAVFDIWSAQASRNSQFYADPQDFWLTVAHRVEFASLPANAFFIAMLPAVFALVAIADAWRGGGWRPGKTGFGEDARTNYLLIIGFALVLWLPFAGFDHQEARYFVPSFVLLALLAGDVFVRARDGLLGDGMRLLPAVMAVLFVAHVVFQMSALEDAVDKRDVSDTNAVAQFIADQTTDGGQIVTLNPTLAVASGAPLATPLQMGQFSFWPKMSTRDALRNGVVNVALLEQLMLDPRTTVIALDDYDLALIADARPESRSVPADADWPFKLFPWLHDQYRVVRRVPDFGQFGGTLYVLVRQGRSPRASYETQVVSQQ